MMDRKKIKEIYCREKIKVNKRLKEFSDIWRRQDTKKIFEELVFCLMTPQSKARVCWETVLELKNDNLLYNGGQKRLSGCLNRVRFRNNKAKYICEARKIFSDRRNGSVLSILKSCLSAKEKREWLVSNIKGMGYKEASHFLRNIGLGADLAVLDRHILKNLKLLGAIGETPKAITKKKYLEIEEKMLKFAVKINIPADCLDLVLWAKETGEVFK